MDPSEDLDLFLEALRESLWSLDRGRGREMSDPLDASGRTVREELTALCADDARGKKARAGALALLRAQGADMTDASALAHTIAMRYFALAHQEAARRADEALAIDLAAGRALPPRCVSDADFDAEVFAAPGPVLVEYWSFYSRPAINLGPEVARLAKEYEGRLTVVRVDVDHRRSRKCAASGMAAVGSLGIPTYVMYRDSAVVAALIGPAPADVRKLAADVIGGRSLDG